MKKINKTDFISLYIDLFEKINNIEDTPTREDLLDLLENKTKPFFVSPNDEKDFSEKISILIHSKQKDWTFLIPNLNELRKEDRKKYFKEDWWYFLTEDLEKNCSYIYENFELKDAILIIWWL